MASQTLSFYDPFKKAFLCDPSGLLPGKIIFSPPRKSMLDIVYYYWI